MENIINTSSLGAKKPGILNKIKAAVTDNVFISMTQCKDFGAASSAFANIAGNESLGETFSQFKTGGRVLAKAGVSAVIGTADTIRFNKDTQDAAVSFAGLTGLEGFTNPQDIGKTAEVKAINIALNSLAHAQTEAAEAMFKTVTITNREENYTFTVRTAGLGRYIKGASAFERTSELTPIMSLIRSGDFFLDDSVRLNPVYPETAGDAKLKFFVPASDFTPWDVSYASADPLSRSGHRTSFLKVGETIPNFLALCQVPNQAPFETSDEIEQNSLKVTRVLLEVNIDGTKTAVSLNTNSYTNNTFCVTRNGHTSDDRLLNFKVTALRPQSLQTYDDTTHSYVADTTVIKLADGGYTPHFSFRIGGNFYRQGATLDTQSGALSLDYVTDEDGNKYLPDTTDSGAKAVFDKFKEGRVLGLQISAFHNLSNRSNLGHRIELYDAQKTLSTRIHAPVSILYSVFKEDVNDEVVNESMDWVITTIQGQTTAEAFKKAQEHVEEVTRINGQAIVGNDQGSNVMAGLHFVNATAVHRSMAIKDAVSTQNNIDALDNLRALFVNNITEIVGALETNSSLAAISEYRKVELTWVVVGHQNLLRYLIKTGDVRTFGAGVKAETIPTNLDPMIGKFYIFPKSQTTDTNIDIIGGMGVMVSKEHRVFQANLTRENKDFGVMVTIPYYQHHSVCPIVGVLEITDAKDALTSVGLVNYLNSQRVTITNPDEIGGGSTDTDKKADGSAGGSETDNGKMP